MNFQNMSPAMMIFVVLSALGTVECQQPLDDFSEISPYPPSGNLGKKLLQQCESFARNLSEENERLKNEVDVLRMKIEAMEDVEEEEEEGEEEDGDGEDEGKDESNESEASIKRLRNRRGTRCDGGTLSAWACAPQCIFKLKGLCGLSLKSICHC